MDPFNRANHQSQNEEQRRLKKAKAERAMRDIELYEEVQKLKNETAAISETVKKRKSHSMFLDAKTLELEEQNAEHIKTVNRQKLQMKEKEEVIEQKDKVIEEQTKMVGTLQMEVKEMKAKLELRDTNLEIKEEIIKMHEQNIGGLEEVQLAETNKNQQEKNDLHEEIAVLKETNQKQAEKIARLKELLITTGHVEQSIGMNVSQIQSGHKVRTLADELADYELFEKKATDDKQEELELEKNCKLPAQKNSEGGEPQKLDDKHKEEQQQTEEGHQQKGGRKLPAPTESVEGNKLESIIQRQQEMDEGRQQERGTADECGQENQQEKKGEKDTEESKNNLPTSEDSGNPFKCSEEKQKQAQMDEGEKEEEEESEGQMPVPTDEHAYRRREEIEGQQPFVIVHAQMVAQSSAAAAAQEEAGQSKGWCFRCVKKTPNEQQNKSPPYSAAGKK
ncbi:hypothetical protein niasHT_037346 [Heterodera trifolii]|uniref:Uncharacterized protein n=1 Tax=Heterodera trifolii TaxID=157864 RepID=A0ABD2J5L2_9BILA